MESAIMSVTAYTPDHRRMRSRAMIDRSMSRLTGRALSLRDGRAPEVQAYVQVDELQIPCRLDGYFVLPLDELPLQVEMGIYAEGFHPLRGMLDWTSIAAGGLLMRDFYLVPLDMPQADLPPIPPARPRINLAEIVAAEDEIELEDEDELQSLEEDHAGENWSESSEDEALDDTFFDGLNDLDACDMSLDGDDAWLEEDDIDDDEVLFDGQPISKIDPMTNSSNRYEINNWGLSWEEEGLDPIRDILDALGDERLYGYRSNKLTCH